MLESAAIGFGLFLAGILSDELVRWLSRRMRRSSAEAIELPRQSRRR